MINFQVRPFRFSTPIGHYSQLVWADTDRVRQKEKIQSTYLLSNFSQIGCGVAEYSKGGTMETLFTCDYGPPGNVMGGDMYQVIAITISILNINIL